MIEYKARPSRNHLMQIGSSIWTIGLTAVAEGYSTNLVQECLVTLSTNKILGVPGSKHRARLATATQSVTPRLIRIG